MATSTVSSATFAFPLQYGGTFALGSTTMGKETIVKPEEQSVLQKIINVIIDFFTDSKRNEAQSLLQDFFTNIEAAKGHNVPIGEINCDQALYKASFYAISQFFQLREILKEEFRHLLQVKPIFNKGILDSGSERFVFTLTILNPETLSGKCPLDEPPLLWKGSLELNMEEMAQFAQLVHTNNLEVNDLSVFPTKEKTTDSGLGKNVLVFDQSGGESIELHYDVDENGIAKNAEILYRVPKKDRWLPPNAVLAAGNSYEKSHNPKTLGFRILSKEGGRAGERLYFDNAPYSGQYMMKNGGDELKYKLGEKYCGFEPGEDGFDYYYEDGKRLNGYPTKNIEKPGYQDKMFKNGLLCTGLGPHPHSNIMFKEGMLLTGFYRHSSGLNGWRNVRYENGKLRTGLGCAECQDADTYYEEGEYFTGTDDQELMRYGGKILPQFVDGDRKLYLEGKVAQGAVYFDGSDTIIPNDWLKACVKDSRDQKKYQAFFVDGKPLQLTEEEYEDAKKGLEKQLASPGFKNIYANRDSSKVVAEQRILCLAKIGFNKFPKGSPGREAYLEAWRKMLDKEQPQAQLEWEQNLLLLVGANEGLKRELAQAVKDVGTHRNQRLDKLRSSTQTATEKTVLAEIEKIYRGEATLYT